MKIELKKEAKIHIVLSGILLVILLFSVITYNIKLKGNRRTFIFPSVENGKLIVETRYLQKKPTVNGIPTPIHQGLQGAAQGSTGAAPETSGSDWPPFEVALRGRGHGRNDDQKNDP